MPAGGEADPGAQVAGDLEDSALFVEVDGVDGEAHKAHVDAVGGVQPQARSRRQRLPQHQPPEPSPPGVSDFHSNPDFSMVPKGPGFPFGQFIFSFGV